MTPAAPLRLVASLLAALLPTIFAHALTIEETRLTAYGIFEEKRAANVSAPLTSAGYATRVAEGKLLKQTDVIEAKLGTTFGIDYVLDGKPVGGTVKLFIRLRRPAITNPDTGETTTIDENVTPAWISMRKHDGFSFDHAWELVPGKWTFQVFHASKLLLEKTFEVRIAGR
jgi:hypothetical protein